MFILFLSNRFATQKRVLASPGLAAHKLSFRICLLTDVLELRAVSQLCHVVALGNVHLKSLLKHHIKFYIKQTDFQETI